MNYVIHLVKSFGIYSIPENNIKKVIKSIFTSFKSIGNENKYLKINIILLLMDNLPDELIINIFKNLNYCKYIDNYKLNSISKRLNYKLQFLTSKCKMNKKIGVLYCKKHILLSLQINLIKNIKYFFMTDFS